MKLYTIGFTQKRAKDFFELLRQNSIQRLVDIRINPQGQLSGFAKQEDLPYLLEKIVPDCQYIYMPELAPTKEMLKEYHADHDWFHYKIQFHALMDERKIPEILERPAFETYSSCLLCSEALPDHCHRRLVAERIASIWEEIEIIHL